MKKNHLLIMLFAIVGLVGLDQFTKILITENVVYGERISIIPSFFYITHHHNPGAAWGILEGQFIIFVIITIFALGLFIYLSYDIDFKRKIFYSLGLTLLIAGTIGNFIDRIAFNYVIDFLDFYIFSYDFPIFNVADMALTIGVTLFAIDLLILDRKRVMNNEESDH